MKAPRVAVRMDNDFKLDGAHPDGKRAAHHRVHCRFHALVGNEAHQIVHPRTPLARRVPRSTSPFHSFKRGCSGPRTTSVAPSFVRAKQRMFSALAWLTTTGECVATSSCES